MDSRFVRNLLSKYILTDGYKLIIDFEKSHGSYLHDQITKKDFLDFCTFYASVPLGYNNWDLCNSEYKKEIVKYCMFKPSNPDFYTEPYAEFVKTFTDLVMPFYMKHLFFIDTGALAVDNALKVAFDWKAKKNIKNNIEPNIAQKVIHFKEAFHGRTAYALSLTDSRDPRKSQYFPLFDFPVFDNPKLYFDRNGNANENSIIYEAKVLKEIDDYCNKHPNEVAALIIEPIQCEGGDNYFSKHFFEELKSLSVKHEFMFIIDEIQTGLGVTGKVWAHEHYEVIPDIICFGKKFQICGIMVGQRIDEIEDNVFRISSRISSTWCGNILDMIRAKYLLISIFKNDCINNAKKMGDVFYKELLSLQQDYDTISNVRGKGLILAFDFENSFQRDIFVELCYEKMNLILLPCGEKSIRIRTVLDIDKETILDGISRIRNILHSDEYIEKR